jgi:uncharacterized protein YeaO (DUF488 family)
MLYSASTTDRLAHYGTVLAVTRASGSAFAPSAELLADFSAGRCGWRQLERRYTQEMRDLYRRDPSVWIDLVEQAAVDDGDVTLVCDECGPEPRGGGEARVRCHRRILKELLVAVGADRGLLVDPDTGGLEATLLEARRARVLAAEGSPLTCPECQRPAPAALAVPGFERELCYCSERCLEAAAARRRALMATPGSGRRP